MRHSLLEKGLIDPLSVEPVVVGGGHLEKVAVEDGGGLDLVLHLVGSGRLIVFSIANVYRRRAHCKHYVDVRSRLCDKVRMRYTSRMTKENAIGVRLEPDELEALRKAAKADARTLSAMLRKYAIDGLRRSGFLEDKPE